MEGKIFDSGIQRRGCDAAAHGKNEKSSEISLFPN